MTPPPLLGNQIEVKLIPQHEILPLHYFSFGSTVSKGRAKELGAARWDEELWGAAAKIWGDDDGNISNVRWQHLVLLQQLFEWIDVECRGSVDLDG